MTSYAEDLNFIASHPMVDFVPELIPPIEYPYPDKHGRARMIFEVNGIGCELTVGVPNRVEEPFYDFYVNAYYAWSGEQFNPPPLDPFNPVVERRGYSTWLIETAEPQENGETPVIIEDHKEESK